MPSRGVTRRHVAKLHGARPGREAVSAALAVEEPLQIRVANDVVAVTMRTPGSDHALALGFLFSEGVITQLDDVSAVFHCGRSDDEDYGNVIEVTPAPGAHVVLQRLDGARRGTLTTAACGVCGRRSIDELLAACGALPPIDPLPRALLAGAPELLRRDQRLFEATGGVHAAAILSRAGEVLAFAEDVGRHNAVDKAIGALLQQRRIPPSRAAGGPLAEVLVVSGRASFEIVQKAAVARLAAVVSISAASSLAVDLAERIGLVVASFARDGHLTVCAALDRVAY